MRVFSCRYLLLLTCAAALQGEIQPLSAQRLEMESVEPSHPGARLVAELAQALIAGDSAGVMTYVLRHADADSDRERLIERTMVVLRAVQAMDRPQLGGFMATVGGVQAAMVDLYDSDGSGFSVIVRTAGNPERIQDVGRGMAPPRPVFRSFEALDANLTERADDEVFSGVVLAARGADVLFHRAYGMADRDRQIPARTDTRFNLGSGNKQFTAVAVLRLAQEGRLALDAPAGRYLRGLPAAIADHVTIRQLLQHRSGLGDFMRHPQYDADRLASRTTSDLLRLVADETLAFEPGTQRLYSNSGYVVLGAVVETLTGRPYHDVVREWVFAPAGMTRTGPDGPGQHPDAAIGYASSPPGDGATLMSNESFRPRPSSAGGGYSTAEDLLKFSRALLANRLLDPEHTRLLLARFDAGAAGGEIRSWELGGGLGGISASLLIDVPSGDVAVVLANRSHPVAGQIAAAVMRDLLDR
jgi:CubicO group peptidase (beta-lactamase class C family)